MRPTYETSADLRNERDVATFIGHQWGVEMAKTPAKYPYDYVAMEGGKAFALIEIKCRNNEASKYETYIISLDKIVQCQISATIGQIAFYLVVQFTDKLLWWEFSQKEFHIGHGGRFDRGDRQDVEPLVHIPMSYFRKLDA
tara:strand:- start:100 stop:522 length:423 start_codon:yes stop_codon:yes gene_type:complete